jgi:hypothetical protein
MMISAFKTWEFGFGMKLTSDVLQAIRGCHKNVAPFEKMC